jgi:hypothetical protein
MPLKSELDEVRSGLATTLLFENIHPGNGWAHPISQGSFGRREWNSKTPNGDCIYRTLR